MNSQKILYSPGDNDECWTPAYGVEPILPYIPKNAIVWSPFDTPKSEFVKLIGKKNTVFATHIDTGQDFHSYTPNFKFDMIISNPPFTKKKEIFRRSLSFGKPFALLMNIAWLNDSAPVEVFAGYDLQILKFDKRIKYLDANGQPKLYQNKKGEWHDKITFSSAYFCHQFLPKQLMMQRLKVD
jgi:hypothetical protein